MSSIKFNYVRHVDPDTGEVIEDAFLHTIKKPRVWNRMDDMRFLNASCLVRERDLLVIDLATDQVFIVSSEEALNNNLRHPVYV